MPIKTDSLSEEEEIAVRDSLDKIRWKKEQEEALASFNALPKISAQEIAEIAPVIIKWTDFYKLDFAQARLVSVDTSCFNCPPNPETCGAYFREFEKELDSNNRIDVDYSPDKQKYVDLGVFYGYDKRENGKYVQIGFDDCQEIYLIDRRQKHQNMIIWLGSASIAEAVFWKSNDIFMVVGYSYLKPIELFVYVFDIKKQIKNCYIIMPEIKEDVLGAYMNKVYWKEKGIIVKE